VNLLVDTHAAIWYLWEPEKLSLPAINAMDDSMHESLRIGVCAISVCELVYLAEKGRIRQNAPEIIVKAIRSPKGMFAEVPVTVKVIEQMQNIPRRLVPDMPDRIIAAAALSYGIPLVTRDRKILQAGIPCIW